MRQRYEETKNVFEGISKAHSQQRGGISGMLDSVGRNINPRRTNDRIRRNISNANEHLSERIRQGAIPKDVRLRSSELNNIGKGAYSRAQISNLEDILNDESFSKRLKEQSTEFLEIAKHAGRKRDTDLFRFESGGDKDEVSSTLLEIIRRHEVDDDLNIRLNFKDDNDLVETAKDFSRAIQEAKLRTREQSQSFNEFIRRPVSNRSNKSMEDNKFAQEYLKDQLTAVEGIISSSGSSDDFVSKAFLDKGYEKLTHKYAKNQVEIRDGKTFITDKIGTKNTVDELYSPSYKSQSGFSKKFQDTARQLGVDESVIKNTAYSSDLFINPETMELINTATTGNIIDEGLDAFQQNLQIPVLGLNPLDYLRDKHKRQQSSVPGAVIYRSGDVSSFTGELFDTAKDMSKKNDKSKGVLAKDYLHIDESIYDGDLFDDILSGDGSVYDNFKASLESNKIADGYQILDTRRGVAKNFADVHSGRVSPDSWEGGPLAKIANINTDRKTVVHDAIDNLTNKNEPTFGQNQPRFIAENIALEDYDMASHNIEDIGKKMQNSKFRLSKNTSEEMKDYFAEAIGHDLQTTITSDMFDTREGMLTVGEMVEAVHSKRLSKKGPGGSDLEALDDVRSRIISSYKKAINDPTDFFESSHYDFRNEMIDSNWANVTGANKPDILTGEDRMRNLLEEYANLALHTQHVDVGEKMSDGFIFNKKGVLEELDQLKTKTEVQFFGNKMSRAGTPSAKKEVADEWINRFGEQENFTTLSNLTTKIEPFGKEGISTSYDSYTDTPYMPIKKHRGLLRSANESYTKAQAGQEGYLADVFESVNESVSAITGHQLNPTTASIAPWELADKLNRPLDKFGLGLKDSQKKSPFSIVAGLSMSRVFMPIVAYQTAKSLDDFFLDGAGRKRVAQTRANISLDLASVKDMTGLTRLGKDLETYIPGYEHLEGSPVGMALRAGTFGFLGDNRSRDELEEYYRSGEDPIRKGRWWELGSTTPWIGERIEYYRPNQYRRTMSDWEYTDTMYGSKREYWSNHWMPNIFNPMAPVKHFITDPYHYENKHEDSRPYAVTGGYSSLNSIPLIGPAVNNMVSSVFKPRRFNPRLAQSHRDYLRAENERLAAAYIGVNTPGMLNVTPKGKFNFEPAPLDFDIIDPETGLVDEEAVITNDMRFASETESIGTGVSVSGVSQEGPGVNITIQDHTRQTLANYNTYLAGVTSGQRPYSPSNVFDAVNPGTVYSTDTLGRSGDYTSLFKGFTDQLKDMMGMRGFLTGEALNFDTEESRLMLEDSSLFNNMRNRFWARDLGGYDGVGGDFSEIMRRFIGGQDKRQYYNPIRNEMPDWINTLFSINSF